MSADATFYRVPKSAIDAGDFHVVRQMIDAEEQFTAYDASGYGFAGLLGHIEEHAPFPAVSASTQQITDYLATELGYSACIPITNERASHCEKVITGASWDPAAAITHFAYAGGLEPEEAQEDFDHAMDVLKECMSAADADHVVLVLIA